MGGVSNTAGGGVVGGGTLNSGSGTFDILSLVEPTAFSIKCPERTHTPPQNVDRDAFFAGISTGTHAVISGGYSNTGSGDYHVIGGGWNNVAMGEGAAVRLHCNLAPFLSFFLSFFLELTFLVPVVEH